MRQGEEGEGREEALQNSWGGEGGLAVPREEEELWVVLRQRGRLQEQEQEQQQQLRFALAVGRRLYGSNERETQTKATRARNGCEE